MKSLSKDYTKEASRKIWRGVFICLAAGFVIAFSLVLMGLIAYYGREYNW